MDYRQHLLHLHKINNMNRCTGCRKEVDETILSTLERKELGISGMCAHCQRSFFEPQQPYATHTLPPMGVITDDCRCTIHDGEAMNLVDDRPDGGVEVWMCMACSASRDWPLETPSSPKDDALLQRKRVNQNNAKFRIIKTAAESHDDFKKRLASAAAEKRATATAKRVAELRRASESAACPLPAIPDLPPPVRMQRSTNGHRTTYTFEGAPDAVKAAAAKVLAPYTWPGPNPYSPITSEPLDIGSGQVRVTASHCSSCE